MNWRGIMRTLEIIMMQLRSFVKNRSKVAQGDSIPKCRNVWPSESIVVGKLIGRVAIKGTKHVRIVLFSLRAVGLDRISCKRSSIDFVDFFSSFLLVSYFSIILVVCIF